MVRLQLLWGLEEQIGSANSPVPDTRKLNPIHSPGLLLCPNLVEQSTLLWSMYRDNCESSSLSSTQKGVRNILRLRQGGLKCKKCTNSHGVHRTLSTSFYFRNPKCLRQIIWKWTHSENFVGRLKENCTVVHSILIVRYGEAKALPQFQNGL